MPQRPISPAARRKKFEAAQAEAHKRFGKAFENLAVVIADGREAAGERLEQLLLEGLNSGQSIEITPEYIEQKRQQLIARHANKTKKP
ncbi:MAG: hypothetical protein FJW38_01795 [Acidobacteria bacterium]|nr:hypothetical protein [Acidobacteriota bacterium]